MRVRRGALVVFAFFFFNDTATTEIYTLSLHDALPISLARGGVERRATGVVGDLEPAPLVAGNPVYEASPVIRPHGERDRKSTRLNSSHSQISYAVFCLKKKKKRRPHQQRQLNHAGAHS